MELARGVSFCHSTPRSSSRLSPRARHSSTSEAVVAVNKSDIFHRTTTKGRKGGRKKADLWGWMRKKAKKKMKKEKG